MQNQIATLYIKWLLCDSELRKKLSVRIPSDMMSFYDEYMKLSLESTVENVESGNLQEDIGSIIAKRHIIGLPSLEEVKTKRPESSERYINLMRIISYLNYVVSINKCKEADTAIKGLLLQNFIQSIINFVESSANPRESNPYHQSLIKYLVFLSSQVGVSQEKDRDIYRFLMSGFAQNIKLIFGSDPEFNGDFFKGITSIKDAEEFKELVRSKFNYILPELNDPISQTCFLPSFDRDLSETPYFETLYFKCWMEVFKISIKVMQQKDLQTETVHGSEASESYVEVDRSTGSTSASSSTTIPRSTPRESCTSQAESNAASPAASSSASNRVVPNKKSWADLCEIGDEDLKAFEKSFCSPKGG